MKREANEKEDDVCRYVTSDRKGARREREKRKWRSNSKSVEREDVKEEKDRARKDIKSGRMQ